MCSTPRVSISVGLLVASIIWSASFPTLAFGQASETSESPVASLRDQLEKGLRARREVERQFVRRIAQLVDQGQLSKEFVQGTYAWTVRHYRQHKSLVPYFERVLRLRAAQAGSTVLNNVPTTLPTTPATT